MSRESNWMGIPDPERREIVQRALTVAGAGSVLLQTFINRVVQMLTLRELGLQAVLDRRPGQGNAAYINRRAPGTTRAQWTADMTAGVEGQGTYTQASFPYRTLLTRGKVSRQLQAKGRSYGDVLAIELSGASEDYAETMEDALWVGNSAANANQINGLLTLVNNVSGQVIANTTNTAGAALVLAKLDKTIDLVKGADNPADTIIAGSKAGVRQLNSVLQAQQQFNDVVEIAAGFRVRSYDGIPIIKSTSCPDVLSCNAAGAILAFSGGATTALAVVSKRYVWIEELTEQTVIPLAKESSQYDLFEIYSDVTLVLANTKGAALLTNLLPG